ncbi:MAG: hypothetical protein ACFB02_19405 [Mastigocoleus sp.]
MHSIRGTIKNIFLFIFKNHTIKIIFYALCISVTLALIHEVLTINTYKSIAGLTLLFSGTYLHIYNKNKVKNQKSNIKVITAKKITETSRSQKKVYTNGGNYNERIERDYIRGDFIETTLTRTVHTNGGSYGENIGRDLIGRDSITNTNIKNITVGKKEVRVNPNNIGETFDELKDVLAQIIAQSSSVLEAISEFTKELTEGLRNRPDVKVCFGMGENISEEELIKRIFGDLIIGLTHRTNELFDINVNTLFQPLNNCSFRLRSRA